MSDDQEIESSLERGFTPGEAYYTMMAILDEDQTAIPRVQEALNMYKNFAFGEGMQHNAKITLVCEGSGSTPDSAHSNFGLVRDYEGNHDWESGQGVAIGEWSRDLDDGEIRLFITSHLNALNDKAIARMQELIIRKQGRESEIQEALKEKVVRKSGPKKAKTPKTVVSVTDILEPDSTTVGSDALSRLEQLKMRLTSAKILGGVDSDEGEDNSE